MSFSIFIEIASPLIIGDAVTEMEGPNSREPQDEMIKTAAKNKIPEISRLKKLLMEKSPWNIE